MSEDTQTNKTLSLEGYHGTLSSNVTSIEQNNFNISRGDNHWLGEGVYFFEDTVGAAKYNALNWAKFKLQRKNSGQKVAVLKVNIN